MPSTDGCFRFVAQQGLQPSGWMAQNPGRVPGPLFDKSSVPAKSDDQLEALIDRIKAEGWDKRFSTDLKVLTAALATQRSQSSKDLAQKQVCDV